MRKMGMELGFAFFWRPAMGAWLRDPSGQWRKICVENYVPFLLEDTPEREHQEIDEALVDALQVLATASEEEKRALDVLAEQLEAEEQCAVPGLSLIHI